jgi:hypothetical protein
VSGKGYRDYEICYLPLSADGHHVNMILGAMKFPEMARPSKAF